MRRLAVGALLVGGILLAPLLAASPPAVKLPPLPKYIPSVLGPVEVHRVLNLMCGTRPALGCWDAETRALEVADSLPLVTAWIVLRHERAHMIFADNVVRFGSADAEDKLADILARADVLEMLAATP